MTVVGAVGDPSTPFVSGMPASVAFATSTLTSDAGSAATTVSLPENCWIPISAPTASTATTHAPTMV